MKQVSRALQKVIESVLLLAAMLLLMPRLGHAELNEIEQQYRSEYQHQIGDKFAKAVSDLDAKYITALERALNSATENARLEEALRLREEIRRVKAKEPSLGNSDESPGVLTSLQRSYQQQLELLTAERQRLTSPILQEFTEALTRYQDELTKAGKLDEAIAVKAFREGNLAERITGDVKFLKPGEPISEDLKSATTLKPFYNSLGMAFVPVPETAVLFCIHEVRWRDYAAFAKVNPDLPKEWRSQTISGVRVKRGEDHPVMLVSWEESTQFCKWLSEREGKTFRLPTDREWDAAVGLTGPAAFEFPWGGAWPPPQGSGNYQDQSRRDKAPHPRAVYLPNYDDGIPTTGPVKSFPANSFGIHDLGGNVWEWSGDSADGSDIRFYRGASWSCGVRELLLSSARGEGRAGHRYNDVGFRIVVEK